MTLTSTSLPSSYLVEMPKKPIFTLLKAILSFALLLCLTELARKLDEKFGWGKREIAQLIISISNVATVLKTAPWLKVLSDDPDNRILECALKAEANFLVTGDRHLLKLRSYENCKIIKLSAFLRIIQQTPSEQFDNLPR